MIGKVLGISVVVAIVVLVVSRPQSAQVIDGFFKSVQGAFARATGPR